MTQVIATFTGALGILANAVIYQQKTGKKLLLCKLGSDVLWALHYFTLGGISAAAIACVGIVRESVFLNHGKRWADSKLWLVLFVALSVLSAALTWKSAFSILPAFASVLSVFSFWRANPVLSKLLAYPISGCMLSYDVYVLSYTGIANELFTLASTTLASVAMLKAARKNRKENP